MRTQDGGAGPRTRTFPLLMGGSFFLLGGINLLNRDWLSACLFLLGGFAMVKGRDIDRWPKPARYLFVLAAVGLAVAVFVRLVLKFKAVG